jgi:hypothetical protein
VIGLLALALAAGDPQPDTLPGCEPEAPIRDPAKCAPLYDDGETVIQNMESVALGTLEQMENLRQQTKHCRVANRIDGVGSVVYVYDIINADTKSRACVRDWIAQNAPDLAFSEEKLDSYFPA